MMQSSPSQTTSPPPPGNSQIYWDSVYDSKKMRVSWFQSSPEPSLSLINKYCLGSIPTPQRILDVGTGQSYLIDSLFKSKKFSNITCVDISDSALKVTKGRISALQSKDNNTLLQYIRADVSKYLFETQKFHIIHDRAVFHFMNTPEMIKGYLKFLHSAILPKGYFVIGTFSLTGPTKCSGIPIKQYRSETLGKLLGPEFKLVHSDAKVDHETPWESKQEFQFSVFQFNPIASS